MQRTSALRPNERCSLQGMRGAVNRASASTIRINDPHRIRYRWEEGYVDDGGRRQTPSVRRNAAARSSVFAISDASFPAAPATANDVVPAWWVTAIG